MSDNEGESQGESSHSDRDVMASEGPPWSAVLETYYEKEIVSIGEPWDESKIPGPIEREFSGYEKQGIADTIAYLWEVGLITEVDKSTRDTHKDDVVAENRYGLSLEGLELAHSRKMDHQQSEINGYIAIFTIVLAASSLGNVVGKGYATGQEIYGTAAMVFLFAFGGVVIWVSQGYPTPPGIYRGLRKNIRRVKKRVLDWWC